MGAFEVKTFYARFILVYLQNRILKFKCTFGPIKLYKCLSQIRGEQHVGETLLSKL